MNFLLYLSLLTFLLLSINKLFNKNNILISETGDRHQKFASKKKVPLTGGIFLFLSFLFFINDQLLSFILYSFLILLLGIFSDLKNIKSALSRFMIQISLVLSFVIFNDLQLFNTKIYLLDRLLSYEVFNYLFVSFCILIIINGSNFLDGLNTLNIGYYLLIILIIYFLEINNLILFNEVLTNYILIVLIIVFFLNFINQIYLGDSGSYLLGFTFSVLLINIYLKNPQISPFFIIVLLWYPSFETLFSIIRKNIMNKSPMKPDSNHLHQQIFYVIHKNNNFSKYGSNLLSANLINLYNLIIFIISVNFFSNSQIQVLLILLNISLYTFIYFKLFIKRYKKL
tara:strand:- start:131 stop:1153 length:1023 start_codon:yes stop_codon:yes gene_type:complete